MNVDIQLLHPDAKVPVYATADAAGADVFARLDKPIYLHPGESQLVPLGFAMAMASQGLPFVKHAAFLLPRSGLGHKHGIVLGNLVGTIDEDFTGELMVPAWNRNHEGEAFRISPGDRIAQMVIQEVRRAAFHVVDGWLSATARGAGGFGSTGSG